MDRPMRAASRHADAALHAGSAACWRGVRVLVRRAGAGAARGCWCGMRVLVRHVGAGAARGCGMRVLVRPTPEDGEL